MGRHFEKHVRSELARNEKSAQNNKERRSLLDTTLDNLRVLLHLEPRREADREPPTQKSWGVGDDPETVQWLRNITQDKLPNNWDAKKHENFEYQVFLLGSLLVSDYYGLSPVPIGMEDNAASAVLADWLDWNGIAHSDRHMYECQVRRVGSPAWNGYATGRE